MQGATASSCVQQCFRPSNCSGTFWRQRCRRVFRLVYALMTVSRSLATAVLQLDLSGLYRPVSVNWDWRNAMKPTLLLSFTSLNTLNYCLRFRLLFQRHRSKFTLELRIGFDCSSISSNVDLKAFLVYQSMINLSYIIQFGLNYQLLMLTLPQNDSKKFI